jgi:hypothetical protein
LPKDNLISVEISPEDLAKVNTALEMINSVLKPVLKTLSPEDRLQLPKMGDKTLAFVQKAVDYSITYPQFMPPFTDGAEFKKDLAAVNTLNQIFRPLLNLTQMLDDSILMAGSDAYIAALSYYNTVKQATKVNANNAKTIYDDLSRRFPGRGPGKKDDEVK